MHIYIINPTVRGLIQKLLELPMNSTIGIALQNSTGDSLIRIDSGNEINVLYGVTNLDYYIQ
jgi:hypothetical protein